MALVWSVSLVVRMILGVLIFGMATAAIVGNSGLSHIQPVRLSLLLTKQVPDQWSLTRRGP